MRDCQDYFSTGVVDGVVYLVDRRVPELQVDGSTIIRDIYTGRKWRVDGTIIATNLKPDAEY